MSKLRAFIESKLQLRKKHYSEDPIQIVRDYRIERENIDIYNGRQILEMLQNVDDACEPAKVKKAYIKLTNNKLLIANNGEPFDEDGILSILNSNVSAKTTKQNKIGQKGRGFRSILSWADEVTIHTDNTSIRFSEKIAISFLKEILVESNNTKIKEMLKKYEDKPFPIAILAVPKLLDDNEKPLSDFDTIIEIELKNTVLKNVQSQISNLINKETLLFLNNLEIIEIDSPALKITFSKIFNKNKSVTVKSINHISDEEEIKTWAIKRKKGKHKGKNYELAVAWSDELNDTENVIYSYFKTKIAFPFPALIHATFELSPDRNNLIEDPKDHNKFLTQKLCELMVESALLIASKNNKANYSALKLLNIDFENIDDTLKTFEFKRMLIDKIKLSKIFPTVNNKYISYADEPVYYKYPVAKILKGEDVKDLLQFTEDKNLENFVYDIFSPFWYKTDHYVSFISNRLKKLDFQDLAKLLCHFLIFYKDKWTDEKFNLSDSQPLLVDASNNAISWDSEIFLPTQEQKTFTLPQTLKVSFINSDLVGYISKELKNEKITDISGNLETLKVKKYSLFDVASSLVKHYNEKKNLNISEIKELHFYLFRLFSDEAIKPFYKLTNLRIPIISTNNKITYANNVYLGKHYDNELADELYCYDKSKILSSPKSFGLENENYQAVKDYFKWLGVAESPRYSIISLNKYTSEFSSFEEYALRNFDYKQVIDYYNESFKDYNSLHSELNWVVSISVGYFDDLKNILSKAKPESIFLWIKQDENLRKTLEQNSEISNDSKITLNLKRKQDYRYIKYQKMRSYVRWLFSTTDWLPAESGLKAAPDKCCLSRTITSEFSPFVEKPKIDSAFFADKLDLSEDVIDNYLILIGVHRVIGTFPIGNLYEMLFSLPETDKAGKSAKSIYREIISNYNENKLDETHPSYQEFIEDGEILCQKGTIIKYFPVNEARYIDTKTFGHNILSQFPLVLIDRKRGTQKVRKLFGVKPLENISFELQKQPELHLLNSEFYDECRKFKGLVYVLRWHQDDNHQIRNRLKRLNIILCQNIDAEFVYSGKSNKFELENFEFIPHGKKLTYYILIPNDTTLLEDLRNSIPFCESIAEIFTTVINSEEHREFIHDLYSKNESNREFRLQSYLQKEDKLEIIEAKKLLGIIDDIRLSFWRAFVSSSSRKWKLSINNENDFNSFLKKKLKLSQELIEIFSSSDTYESLSEIDIQEIIYDLFLSNKVDYKNFTRHFSGLDFTPYFKNSFEDIKRLYRPDFEYKLYKKLSNKELTEKKKYFDYSRKFEELQYSNNDGFLLNSEQFFIDKVKTEFSVDLRCKTKSFVPSKIISKNLQLNKNNGVVISETLLEHLDVQVLLLFNEVEELKKLADPNSPIQPPTSFGNSTSSKRIRVRGKDVDYDDYPSLAEQVLKDLDFSKFKIKTSKAVPFVPKGRGGGGGGNRSGRFATKNEEQVGFISELLGYRMLCQKYGESNVRWISENSYRAKSDLTGEAGKGYDIELNENGRTRFIEVKGISDTKSGVKITSNEIKKALEFPDKYDLFIIENPLSDKPNFRHWKNPFKFRSGESFISNSKFRVFNDNYVLKFDWNE